MTASFSPAVIALAAPRRYSPRLAAAGDLDRTAHVLLMLLLLFELGNTAQYCLADRADREQMQWLDRCTPTRTSRRTCGSSRASGARKSPDDAFAPNWGAFHGVEMHGGKMASVTTNVLDSEFFGLTGRRMYGVAYTIAEVRRPNAGAEVFAGAAATRCTAAMPSRAPGPCTKSYACRNRRRAIFSWAATPRGFHHRAHMVAPPPKVEPCTAAEKVELIEHHPIASRSAPKWPAMAWSCCRTPFYPGWRARWITSPRKSTR